MSEEPKASEPAADPAQDEQLVQAARALRQGLNEAEATMLRIAAARGDKPTLWESLDPLSAQAMKAAHKGLDGEPAPSRELIIKRWAVSDAQRADLVSSAMRASVPRQKALLAKHSPRWQRAIHRFIADPSYRAEHLHRQVIARQLLAPVAFGPHQLNPELVAHEGDFDLGILCGMERPMILRACMRIGIAQLAQLLRQLDRRELARHLRELPDELRRWMREDFAHERDLDPQELARIREVFVHLSRDYPAWEERALHVGLFFVATSAGERYNTRVARLEQLLPPDLSRALDRYLRRSQYSSRRGLDLIVRRSLGALIPLIKEVTP